MNQKVTDEQIQEIIKKCQSGKKQNIVRLIVHHYQITRQAAYHRISNLTKPKKD